MKFNNNSNNGSNTTPTTYSMNNTTTNNTNNTTTTTNREKHILGNLDYCYSENQLSVLLKQSVKLWVADNEQKYLAAYNELEQIMSDQFLFLYGNTYPTVASLIRSSLPCPTSWNMQLSNPALTFSNNNLTVERVGNVSSYPALFADLPLKADISHMKIRLDYCPRGPNWLTIGITRKAANQMMANASSDGFGRTSHTWGIHDDRSAFTGLARVSANGQDVAMCRKFQQGDIINVIVDVSEVSVGKC